MEITAVLGASTGALILRDESYLLVNSSTIYIIRCIDIPQKINIKILMNVFVM